MLDEDKMMEELRDKIGNKLNEEMQKLFDSGGYNHSMGKSMDFHGSFLQVMAMITGKIIDELFSDHIKDDVLNHIVKIIKSKYSVKEKKINADIDIMKIIDSNAYIH